jgi:OmpA-OmpF porin, OOP family
VGDFVSTFVERKKQTAIRRLCQTRLTDSWVYFSEAVASVFFCDQGNLPIFGAYEMTVLKLNSRASLLALAVLASPILQAQDLAMNNGLYVGISSGESKAQLDNGLISQHWLSPGVVVNALTSDQKGTGYKAFVGFPMNSNWAIETGYFDLGRFGFDATTSPAGTVTGSSRIKGLNLDIVGTLPISDSWSLLGRIGAAYAQTKGSYSGTDAGVLASTETNKRETNYKYGFGTQYAFTPAFTMRLEGERYRVNDAVGQRTNVDLITLGLVYRFGGSSPVAKSAYAPYVPPVAEPVYKAPPVVAQVIVPVPVVLPAPLPTPAPKPWVKVKLAADSLFGFDQDSLQNDGKQALEKLLLELKDVNVESVQVTGHTDRLGTKAYNDKLSMRRAEAVRNYLVQMGGLPATKVSATGVGSAQPEGSTNDCKGMKASQALITCLRVDRRVDVEVMGSQQQR